MLKLLLQAETDVKIFKKLFEVNELEKLINEIINTVEYYLDNLYQQDKIMNEVNLFELLGFFNKLITNISSICNYEEYNCLKEIILKNIKKVLDIKNKGQLIFLNFWKIVIINKIDIDIISKFDPLNHIFELYSYNFSEVFSEFVANIQSILGDIKYDNFITYMNNILTIYPQANYILKTYFNKYKKLNKEKILTETLLNGYDTTKDINNNASVNQLVKLIACDGIITKNEKIIRMLKINLASIPHQNIFIAMLLKSFKVVLRGYISSNKNIEIIKVVDMLWSYYFKDKLFIAYIKDEQRQNLNNELKLILSDTLNMAGKAPVYALSFNQAILENDKELINSLYSYLDILDDISTFEERYTVCLLDRALYSEAFNITFEKEVIENIIQTLKDKFIYSYKLQTVINNIKVTKTALTNIVGIPSHCYLVLNIGCQPIINNSLQKVFETNKTNIPTNSKLIYQQGSIEFTFKENWFIVNTLQYSLLLDIKEKKGIEIERLLEQNNVTELLFDFLIEKLEKDGLVYVYEKKYFINTKYKRNSNGEVNNEKLNLRCNLDEFIENKRSNVKMTQKHYNNVVDCYIIKFLKKLKQAECQQIYSEIKSIQFLDVHNVTEKLIEDRLGYLTSNDLLKSSEGNKYSYI
jgi:hypothetical protein